MKAESKNLQSQLSSILIQTPFTLSPYSFPPFPPFSIPLSSFPHFLFPFLLCPTPFSLPSRHPSLHPQPKPTPAPQRHLTRTHNRRGITAAVGVCIQRWLGRQLKRIEKKKGWRGMWVWVLEREKREGNRKRKKEKRGKRNISAYKIQPPRIHPPFPPLFPLPFFPTPFLPKPNFNSHPLSRYELRNKVITSRYGG